MIPKNLNQYIREPRYLEVVCDIACQFRYFFTLLAFQRERLAEIRVLFHRNVISKYLKIQYCVTGVVST
jgi:hypothetical protein